MQAKKRVFIIILAAIALTVPAGRVYADLTNEGNKSLTVEIETKSRSEVITIYPNQSINMPRNAIKLKVIPAANERGDEIVKLRVIGTDGKKYYVNEMKKVLDLVQPAESEKTAALTSEIKNNSNKAVMVLIKNKTRNPLSEKIMPGESIPLSADALEVTVTDAGFMMGNEIISVPVRFANGQSATITNVGGSAKLLIEKNARQ